ncbi:MAG: MBL fold metallo-hydrolase [Bacilli bacterium]|nr:MBL fold metallo-hydrolase [Bacilli bacterium]
MSQIKITALGTISPYCKLNRNCPSFMIEVGDQKILLDCGNGSSRLLNFPEDLKNLHIFITHYHKDHYGDLGAIQSASFTNYNLGIIKDPINIYLPEEDYNKRKETILLDEESYATFHNINENTNIKIKEVDLSFADNNSHTIKSYMVQLKIGNLKIVYTSDVGNTNLNHLINFCKDADLLISESSLLRKHQSKLTTHLTAYEAGKIAALSGTKRLLLTHFWPEEDPRLYLQEAKENFQNVTLAKEGKKMILRMK